MRRLSFLFLVLAAAAWVSSQAWTQPPGPGRGQPPRPGPGPEGRPGMQPGPLMEALDTDHDGVLSAEEIKNAVKALERLDRNRDGKITPDELRPGRGPGDPRGGRGPEGGRPPEGRPRGQGDAPPPPGREGPPGGPPAGAGQGGIIPPFARDRLRLTEEQEKQIRELEGEVRGRLGRILTEEQKRLMEELRPGPGRPGEGNRPPRPERETPPPPAEDPGASAAGAAAEGGIQWFATLASGLREAQRSGKPILFLSAAPHCAGVSGIW